MSDYLSPAIKLSARHYQVSLVIAWTLAVICCLSPQGANASDSELHFDGRLSWLTKAGATIKTITIEIAETPAQRAQGLKERPVPDFSQGMLFVYKNTDMRTFIMTDTPTSLDIIFIDEIRRCTPPYFFSLSSRPVRVFCHDIRPSLIIVNKGASHGF